MFKELIVKIKTIFSREGSLKPVKEELDQLQVSTAKHEEATTRNSAAQGKSTKEMEKAMDVWNDMPDNPLSGSHFAWSIGTTDGLPRPILPDITEYYNGFIEIIATVEPFKAKLYQKFKEQAFLDKLITMNTHLAQAAEYAKQAIVAANDQDFIGICYYTGMNGRPTCKQYAELNYAPIAIADALCRQRCNMLRAYHLLTELENARAAGDEKLAGTKGKLYHELIRKDIGVQEHFYALLTGFAAMRPCYTRTSLTEREISDLLLNTRAKIEKLKKFLKTK